MNNALKVTIGFFTNTMPRSAGFLIEVLKKFAIK